MRGGCPYFRLGFVETASLQGTLEHSLLLQASERKKRPLSPPPKSSGKGPAAPSSKPPVPASAPTASSTSGSSSGKASNTLSRREELLKQLKAVEDAIARKRAKIPAK
ncbi:hypothetical protein ATANTOWER_017753 [Ataeniobius toweri]|uniref:Uncharacterized protein n=1 Tax=Ataeniobius toweri TaxID=208326 RepID=A0ABU7BGM0_9TELE|nr:hypothetical protein [Ataeniobius toweri]